MVQNLEGMGFTVVPFGQGFKDMSPPTKELIKLTLEKKLAHGGHPVLRWMMDNIFIRQDPAGNIKADKEKSTEKIDGAIATIMALDRAIPNLMRAYMTPVEFYLSDPCINTLKSGRIIRGKLGRHLTFPLKMIII